MADQKEEQRQQAGGTEEGAASLLDSIMQETKIRPSDDSYGVAKRGLGAFIKHLVETRATGKINQAAVIEMIAEIDRKLSAQVDAVLHHEAEGDGHHREVGTAHPQRRQREQAADQRRERDRERQRQPEIQLRRGGQDRHRVGADGIEADVAEGHLAGKAEQDVQADADDGGKRQRRHDEDVIAVCLPGEQQGAQEQQYK